MKGVFFYGHEVVLPKEGGWSFHSFGSLLMPCWVPAAADRGTHSYCPQLSWRRAKGTWGKVVVRSAEARVPERQSIWEETGWVTVGVFLSPILHGTQAELPAGSHPVPHWWMAEGI